MRVVHVVSSVSRLSGGVGPVVWSLARYQREAGIDAVIVSLEDDHSKADAQGWPDVPLFLAKRGSTPLGYSSDFSRLLGKIATGADLIHSHGLWLYPGFAARKAATRAKLPFMLSPHGMLHPWAYNHRRWKKAIAGVLFENGNLDSAHCLHATASGEAENIRAHDLQNPIAIVPIGLETEEYCRDSEPASTAKWDVVAGERVLLFLSRIHPVKGLLNLAKAWNTISSEFPAWRLIVAGPDATNHRQAVESVLKEGPGFGRVLFTGPVYGDEKLDLLRVADLFVLPTHSENFGIVVLEALACGVPVITTKGAPWQELTEEQCGWWVDLGVEPLTKALRQAMALPEADRQSMGMRGRRLVQEKYHWPQIVKQIQSVYEWMLGSATKPDCLRFG